MPSTGPRGFAEAKRRARTYAQDPKKTGHLLTNAINKAYQHRTQLRAIWNDLMSLIRMLKAWSNGQYRRVPWRALILSLASVIYFLNPFDLAPDFIPGIGYVDDAVVLTFVVNSIRKEIHQFLQWEQGVE